MYLLLAGMLVVCMFSVRPAQAQEFVGLRYENYNYGNFVGAVRFHVEGLRTSYPIVDLEGGTRLFLSFDDLDGGVRDYYYTIIHCDRDWHPSQLNSMEYIDGYNEERILDFRYSNKTLEEYTHYQFHLPNQAIRWTKSGNYLLVVYEKDGDHYPVITRRFVVAERKIAINPQIRRASQPSKMRTHQEINFLANFEKFPLRNPQQDIKAVVLQNGRWSSALDGIPPRFVRANELLFDYQDKIIFPGLKEFRFLDLRSFRYISQNIGQVERMPDRLEVTLLKDRSRAGEPYIEIEDLNGDFIIETQDQNNVLAADYAQVLFTYYTPEPFYDHNLYLMGNFTNWQTTEYYQMKYNNVVNGYVIKLPIKQGFYNYAYGLTKTDPRKDEPNPVDFSQTEGNWFETENNYTILLYYHPFGARYDRVVGFVNFSSN